MVGIEHGRARELLVIAERIDITLGAGVEINTIRAWRHDQHLRKMADTALAG
jgi:hypothetical protein